MGKMGMDGIGFKNGITCKLRNETDPGFPQECVGNCIKSGRVNGAMESPDIRTRKGTYDAVILEKRESLRLVRSYADVTRKDLKTPSGQNRLIIS